MQGKSSVLLLFVLYGSAFIAGFNENLANMALMSIMGEYGIDSVTAQWLVTGYMIVATIGVMCMAYLYRRFKLRPLYFAAAALTLVGSAMGLVASNFTVLLVSRLIAAMGSGIFIPLMMNTILNVAPKNKLGAYISIGGCMITFGPALAPVVCGAIVTAFGWHCIFIVPIVATVVFSVLALFAVENLGVSAKRPHLDPPSVALSVIALCALSIGLAELTIVTVPAVILLVVAVFASIAFAWRQLHCDHPLIDLAPMKSAAFWPSVPLVTVAMMGSFSSSVLLPLYFEGAIGLTAAVAGTVLLVPVLGNAGATLIGGRVMDKRGGWPLLPLGFGVVAVGFGIMVAMAPACSLPVMFAAAFIVYAGTGLVMSPSQAAGLRTLPPEQNPHGVALSTTFIQIAACIGPSLYTGILASGQGAAEAAGAAVGVATAQGFAGAMVVACVIAAAGCVLAFVYARAAVRRDAERSGSEGAQG